MTSPQSPLDIFKLSLKKALGNRVCRLEFRAGFPVTHWPTESTQKTDETFGILDSAVVESLLTTLLPKETQALRVEAAVQGSLSVSGVGRIKLIARLRAPALVLAYPPTDGDATSTMDWQVLAGGSDYRADTMDEPMPPPPSPGKSGNALAFDIPDLDSDQDDSIAFPPAASPEGSISRQFFRPIAPGAESGLMDVLPSLPGRGGAERPFSGGNGGAGLPDLLPLAPVFGDSGGGEIESGRSDSLDALLGLGGGMAGAGAGQGNANSGFPPPPLGGLGSFGVIDANVMTASDRPAQAVPAYLGGSAFSETPGIAEPKIPLPPVSDSLPDVSPASWTPPPQPTARATAPTAPSSNPNAAAHKTHAPQSSPKPPVQTSAAQDPMNSPHPGGGDGQHAPRPHSATVLSHPTPAGVTEHREAESVSKQPKKKIVSLSSVAFAKGQRDPSQVFEIDQILKTMLTKRASDVHLTTGQPIIFRVDGEITRQDSAALDDAMMERLILPITPQLNLEEYVDCSDTDFAYEIPGLARFRVNLFRDINGVAAVLRHIPSKIPTAEDLKLAPAILKFCRLHKGLVVVTGPTGSGKSTTLAAMVDKINKSRSDHLLTIEDPVEFVHPQQKCLVNQREIRKHTGSFARALRAALREDPDIILVGEMRDLETVSIAIETAETGHLVFGTLHTTTAISTVDRIIDQFPEGEQAQVRMMLSASLKGVIAQTLIKKKGGGRCAAQEILVVNDAVSSLIREGKTHMIANHMQTQQKEGNQLLNTALANLVSDGLVEITDAYAKSIDRKGFIEVLKRRNIDTKAVDVFEAA